VILLEHDLGTTDTFKIGEMEVQLEKTLCQLVDECQTNFLRLEDSSCLFLLIQCL